MRIHRARRTAGWIVLAVGLGAPSARPLSLVYTGHDFADLYLSPVEYSWHQPPPYPLPPPSTNGTRYRVVVYRNGVSVHTADSLQTGWLGWTDRGLARNRRYVYTADYYTRPSGSWVYLNSQGPVTADTARCRGHLHNNRADLFNRPPVVWSGAVSVNWVVVMDGLLRIQPDAVVELGLLQTHYSFWYDPPAPAPPEIQASRATFIKRGNPDDVALVALDYRYRAAANPTLSDCVLSGIVMRVAGTNVHIVNNRFAARSGAYYDMPRLTYSSAGGVLRNNRGLRTLEASGRGSLVANNEALILDASAPAAEFRSNRVGHMDIRGNGSQYGANTTTYVLVRGDGNRFESNRLETLPDLPASSMGIRMLGHSNTVAHNTTMFGITSVSGTRGNVIRDNYFLGGGYYAVSLEGRDHRVYNNYFTADFVGGIGADYGTSNRWYRPKAAGRNIAGGPFLGGNYWGGYDGADADGDGLGDTPLPIAGSAGARDLRPLIGAGELVLMEGSANPRKTPIHPQGQPFLAARVQLLAARNSAVPPRVQAMTFTFVGHPHRLQALAGASLFAAHTGVDSDHRLIARAEFVGNRVTFRMSDTLTPGQRRHYALAYLLRYEDEYRAPSGVLPPGSAMPPDILLGGELRPDDILCGPARAHGQPVRGTVTPAQTLFVSACPASMPAPLGRAMENTAEVLFAWSRVADICAAQNPALLLALGPADRRWYLYLKDRRTTHAFSRFANRPSFLVQSCSGHRQTSRALPVCEVLDIHLQGGRPVWARGAGYEDPYVQADWLFDGEIALHATAAAGNFAGFLRTVVTPLRAAFGGPTGVIIAQYRTGSAGGYYGRIRIRTRRGTQHALARLKGARVLDQKGRRLMVHFQDSTVRDPPPDERMFEWGGGESVSVCADYDGDGQADLAVYEEPEGAWRIWLSSRGQEAVAIHGWGGAGWTPVPADYDGDGRTDPAVYVEAAGTWRLWISGQGYAESSASDWGAPGWKALPADYDGDGRADPAICHVATGVWHIRLSTRSYELFLFHGDGGPDRIPVPADYDGDGRTDPAVYTAATGAWHIGLSSRNHQTLTVSGWGAPGLDAVPADYDGDRRADPAVLDPDTGRRRIWRSSRGYNPYDR